MKREIIKTSDGSTTIRIPEWDEQYHSKHGALQEAYHVFIKSGLYHYLKIPPSKSDIKILEIGFGTGLNALITLLEAEKNKLSIDYTGVEAYPVGKEELSQLNYSSLFENVNAEGYFRNLHRTAWETSNKITDFFNIEKQQKFFKEITDKEKYNLIYFDAFGARVQPELWEEAIFQKMYNALQPKGILTTYSAKGSAKRAMLKVGFEVDKIPGPPGKREMLRAQKA